MPKWDWLKERKQQALLEKQQQPMNFAQMPVGARYPTGNGGDGVMQPHMPVAQVPTAMGPRMIHEGEEMRKMPGGNVNVVSQRELLEEEKTKNIPGYQQGGQFRPVGQRKPLGQTGTARPPQQPGTPAPQRPIGGGQPGRQTTSPTPGGWGDIIDTIKDPDIPVPDPNQGKGWQNVIENIKLDKVKPAPTPITGPQGIDLPNIVPDIVGPEGQNLPNINPDIQGQQGIDLPNIIPDIQGPEGQGLQDIEGGLVPQGGQKLPGPLGPIGRLPTPDPVPDPDPTDPDKGYEEEFQSALGRIGQIDSNQAAYQKYLDDMAARQATEELVGQQRLAQAGVGGVEGRTAGMMMGREHGMEMGQLAAEGGIKQMELEEQAAAQKAQLAMQGMQFDWQKESFQQQMDFAKEKYGDQKGGVIADLVNKGVSLKQLQEMFPDMNITQEDYDSMKEMSPMGMEKEKWDYQKKVDSFNQMVAQGGAENFAAAADMFNEMFGTDIDFSNALTEENKEAFNTSWNDMIGAIAGGTSFEDWLKSAKASDTFDNLNMTEDDVAEMYGRMQLQNNPVYQAMQQYDQMLEDGIIDQDDYDRIMDALNYGLSHPEGFEFSDSFQVLDANGNEVKNFKTQEEADQYLADNPNQGYTINQEKDGWVEYTGGDTGPSGGTTGDPNNPYKSDVWDDMGEQEQWDSFQESLGEDEAENWTKDKWIEKGKPQTLGGYKEENPYSDITGNVLNDEGGLDMSMDDLSRVIEGIKQGNEDMMNNYGVPENSKMMNAARNPDTYYETRAEMDAIVDEFNANKGKIMIMPDGTSWVIAESGVVTTGLGGMTIQSLYVDVVNPETGERQKIPLGRKRGKG